MSTNTTSLYNGSSHVGNVFLQVVLIIEMIVGLPGNIMALWVFCFRMKRWKPHVIFLFNLLLADLLLLLSLPFRIDANRRQDGNKWVFGGAWCRINLFMLAVNRSSSIAFMTTVATDRYFKVVHPYHCISRLTSNQASLLGVLIWAAVIAVRVPLLTIDLLHKTSNNTFLCQSFHPYKEIPAPVLVHYVAYIAEFFLPWFLLIFCSVSIICHLHRRGMDRHKMVRRAIVAVTVISVVFTVCFMPSVVTGLGGWYVQKFLPESQKSYNLLTQAFMMCTGFTYLNSALDPVIYMSTSTKFREVVKSSVRVKKRVRATKSS